MNMNKAFRLKNEERAPQWRLIDAKDQVLGRLATKLADIIRGKDKPYYSPDVDAGDYVVVINADKIILTGNKWDNKEYARYTGYIGGYRTRTAKEMLKKHPEEIIKLAVKRMLPKNRISREVFKKLKVYVGAGHPHQAQLS